MATTLFFTTSSSVAISPAVSTGWLHTANTGFVRRVMSTTDSGSTSDQETNQSGVFPEEVVQIQYISAKPLRAQTISGDLDIETMQFVSATGATHFAFHVRVVTSAGALRGELVDLTDNTNAITSSYATVEELGVALSSVVCSDGDRIVVELGYTINNSTAKDMGTRAGSGFVEFTDTITWIDPPANLVYLYTAYEGFIDDVVTTNTATYTDNGGTHTFSVQTGALPAGVTLNTSTGTISGTPTVDGVYTVTIRVANSEGSTDSAAITWTILPPSSSTLNMGNRIHMKMGIQ